MRPSSLLRRVRRVAVVVFIGCQASAAELPEGTLAVVAAKSLQDLDATAARLLEPWRLKFNGLRPIIERLAPGAEVPSGPAAIGVVKVGANLFPFALLATDKADELERAVRARPVAGRKSAIISGYPVSITRVDGGVCLTYSAALRPAVETGVPLAEIEDLLGDANAAVTVTDRGFDEAAMWASRLGFVRGRFDLTRVRSLKGLMAMLPRLGVYAPFLRSLALETKGATLLVNADPDSDSLDATLDVAYANADEAPPAANDAATGPTLDVLLGERTPIATFRSDRPLPAPLVRLALAWAESRPDDIDADRYDPRSFAAYAESASNLLGAVRLIRLAWIVPTAGEPLATNGVEYVRVREGADMLDAIEETTEAMNETIRRSRAGTPLIAALDPLVSPDGAGVRMTTDVLKALGGEGLEEVREVLQRYYGPDGRHVVDFTPLGDDAWLRASPPAAPEELRARLKRGGAPADDEQAELLVWIDRWLAWKQSLDDVGKNNDLGRKVRPPMAASLPLRLQLNAAADRLRCEAALPTDAYEAMAAYWVAEKIVAQPAP